MTTVTVRSDQAKFNRKQLILFHTFVEVPREYSKTELLKTKTMLRCGATVNWMFKRSWREISMCPNKCSNYLVASKASTFLQRKKKINSNHNFPFQCFPHGSLNMLLLSYIYVYKAVLEALPKVLALRNTYDKWWCATNCKLALCSNHDLVKRLSKHCLIEAFPIQTWARRDIRFFRWRHLNPNELSHKNASLSQLII